MLVSRPAKPKTEANRRSKAAKVKKSYPTLVNQQDIAPTLAFLSGVAIPNQSIGLAIPQVLDIFGVRNSATDANGQHIAQLYKKTFPTREGEVDPVYQQYVEARDSADVSKIEVTCRMMSSKLQDSMLTYRMEWVLLAVTSGALTFLCLAYNTEWDLAMIACVLRASFCPLTLHRLPIYS